ncbi:MAG TPA: alpha/beta hydrolase [Dehalococcoidia bacterium]|nr:alpha/beta hydrolase [Dehalococcoidia bacterium]
MPSPQLQTVISFLRSRPIESPEVPIEQARATFDAVANMFVLPDDVIREPVDVDGTPGEWISTPTAQNGLTLLYLHGGGYVIGSINSHRDLISRLARAAGARALAIDYRLAPEHPFPAAVEDATKAYRWLLRQGVRPEKTVVAGDSAGGGLTVATLLALRDAGDALPAAAVCISPWTDLEIKGETMVTKKDVDPMIRPEDAKGGAERYHGNTDPSHPLISPINADLSGLPPMLVQVGTSEVLMSDSTRLAQRAEAAGVEVTLEQWEEMIHVWHFFAFMLPEGQQAIERIGQYVRGKVPAIVHSG